MTKCPAALPPVIAKVKLSFLEAGSDGPRATAKAVVIGGVTPGGLDRYAARVRVLDRLREQADELELRSLSL